MHILGKKHWEPFEKDGGVHGHRIKDGTRFEELTEHLLNHCFRRNYNYSILKWERRTHPQGARDFVAKIGDGEIWVECKNYKETVSRITFSPTLAMAPLSGVKEIILFSFSRINNNGLRFLGDYQLATGKRIRAYHDESLEHLILSCDKALETYFPDVLKQYPETCKRISHYLGRESISMHAIMTTNIDNDAQAHFHDGDDEINFEAGIVEVSHSSIIAVDVLLENKNPMERITGRLEIDISSMSPPFYIVGNIKDRTINETVSLHPASFHRHRFHLSASKPFSVELRPEISFHFDEASSKSINCRTPHVLSWVHDLTATLVGASRVGFRDNIGTFITGNVPTICMIHGFSGVGKTRLLDESCKALVKYGMHIHRIDGEMMDAPSLGSFLKVLLEKISPSALIHDHSVSRQEGHGPFWNHEYDILLSKVFHGEELGTERDVLIAAGCIAEIIRNTCLHRAIIIDNLQNFPWQVTKIIEYFADSQRWDQFAPLFLLVVNTELASSDSPGRQLLESIKKREGQRTRFQTLQLNEFTDEEFTQFINEFFIETITDLTFTEKYGNWVNVLHNDIMRRPLYLQQLLHYLLCEKNILEWDHASGYLRVVSPDGLGKIVRGNYLPGSLEELMLQRWKIISDHICMDEKKSLAVFTLLGSLFEKDADSIGISLELLTNWRKQGIVKRTKQKYIFYHNQIRVFFVNLFFENNPEGELVRSVYEHVHQAVRGSNSIHRYAIPYLVSCFYLDRVEDSDSVMAMKTIANRGSAHGLELLLNGFSSYIEELCHDGPTEYAMNAWITTAERLRHDVDYQEGIDLYVKGVDLLTYSQPINMSDDRTIDMYVRYMIMSANAHLTGHDDMENLRILKLASDWATRSQITADTRSFLYNRLCVAYKSVNDPNNALQAGAIALKAAHECSERDKRLLRLFFAHVDIANVFQNGHALGDVNNIASLGQERMHLAVKNWQRAIDLVENERGVVEIDFEIEPIIYLYKSQCMMLSKKYEKAMDIIESGIVRCKKINSAFFGVKLTILRGVISLLMPDLFESSFARESIALDAIRWANSHNVHRYAWTARYLQAKMCLARDDAESAACEFMGACLELTAACKHRSVEEYHYHFFDDYALASKRWGWEIPGEVIRKIKSRMLRARIKTLMSLNVRQFTDTLSRYRPSARFWVPQDSPFQAIRNTNLPTP